jgi:predicted adenine nucleotide alpha hydrolase (AANH) superfamily ATPase
MSDRGMHLHMYDIRKNENKRYAIKHSVPFVDCDYDDQAWLTRMQGLEFEPERGALL